MSLSSLWSAAQAAAADAHTMDVLGTPSVVLMERASLCVAAEVQAVARGRAVVCLVGPGNNGGDALAVARILRGRGLQAHAWLVTPRRNEAADAQLSLARSHDVQVHESAQALPEEAVWVDGLLGTGATGAARGAIAEALEWVRGRPGPHVAIDVPSGIGVDSGEVPGAAFEADVTVTFVRSKPGLHITPGRDHTGQVVVADIGIVAAPGAPDAARALTADAVAGLLTTFPRSAPHKGARGHVGVLGGSPDTPGAAVLAGVAAMRSGAGLCTLIGTAVPSGRPELMHAPLRDPLLPSATALVVGPGLTELPPQPLLETLYLQDPRPAVWDASALDAMPLGGTPLGPRIVTPHPGEAARLLARAEPEAGWTSARVQAERRRAVHALQAATGATVVLKGAGSLVCEGDALAIAVEGSDALATAGSGDVLAGCLGGLLAQGLSSMDAACVGVSVHGRAGDAATQRRPLALEIADALPEALHAATSGRVSAGHPRLRQG